MDKFEVIEELKKIIGDYLAGRDLVLVDLIYRQEGRDLVLRVLADRPSGGINLDECASLNAEIGSLLDQNDLLQGSYLLEVSSPGLDRPLMTVADFRRCIDRKVHVFLKEQQEGKWEFEGLIKKVSDGFLYLQIDDTNVIEIPLTRINKAKQMI